MLASPRISGQRIHRGEIVAKAVWPALISPEDGAKIRSLLANPERRTNKTARRYLLGGICSSVATAANAWSPVPAVEEAALCLRERPGLLRLRQDLYQR